MGIMSRLPTLVLFSFAVVCIGNALAAKKVSDYASRLTGQALVDYVNSHQSLWKAQLNTVAGSSSLGYMKSQDRSGKKPKKIAESRYLDVEIPKEFDARTKWPKCKSIGHIRDQSSCGSCWAFGTTEVMTDRVCIASNGTIAVSLSAVDVTSCANGLGCGGGNLGDAFDYWNEEGVVTGSDNPEHQGCLPYPFKPCEHHNNHTTYPQCKKEYEKTPECKHKCQRSYTKRSYSKDKFYGQETYTIEDGEKAMQKEILANGPIAAALSVYEDFLTYKSGIYEHTAGGFEGGHAVRILGWGEEKGTPYWIVANSWNPDWGDKGFFRIKRGVDECRIESDEVVAAKADLKRSPSS